MKKKEVLACDRCRYRTSVIGDPCGIPFQLVPRCVVWHEMAHKGHKVKVVPLSTIK